MDATQKIYFALGNIAYAISGIDGKSQKEEFEAFKDILHKEFNKHPADVDIAEIEFELLKKDKIDPEMTLEWGLKELRKLKPHIEPWMPDAFVKTALAVAEAYPALEPEEKNLLNKLTDGIKSVVDR